MTVDASFLLVDFLAFVFIPLGIFFLLGWLIYYHLNKYGIKGDSTKKVALLFVAILFLISFLIISLFFIINWNEINIEEFIENSNISLYNK